MRTFVEFTALYLPVGFGLGLVMVWWLMMILSKKDIVRDDVLQAIPLSFGFGFNLTYILWGVALL